ncbi:MAG: hypothetical protein KF849_07405 [Rhizobiaceae bacterium]|nr:hypothetical protein [Rhizobiaceae bacterium]
MKKTLITALTLSVLSFPALAEWRLDNGVAIVEPTQTNSNIELVAVLCGDPFQIEVYARGGPVQPADQEVAADYFYKPGKVRAAVDGQLYPLAAAGSDGAVVLFGEGSAAENYLGRLPFPMIETMKSGKLFTLAFDITPAKNADGSAYETVAVFPLDGSRAALDQALGSCGGG